jgi:membrane protease YdiL (CAAX protease family)
LVALFPLIAYGILAVILRLSQGNWPGFDLLGQVQFLPNLGGGAFLFWVFTYGLGEEIGWRGFALPRLQTKWNALSANLVLWFFWALWHWPMFFYTYDPAFLPMIMLRMLTGTVFLTWFYNSTGGSLLMMILWHGSYDFITASKSGEGIIATIVTAAVMIWAFIIIFWFKPANLSNHPRVTTTLSL